MTNHSLEQALPHKLHEPPSKEARPAGSRPTGTRVAWAAPAGFSLLVVTIMFLMALVVAAVLDRPVPCSGRGLVVFVIALSTGGAAAFLTGSAKAEGKLPFLGHNVLTIAASGAMAAIVIVLVAGFRLYAADGVCESIPPTTEREQQTARLFWEHAFAGKWKAAYDLFPPALNQQTKLPDFAKASSAYLSQFDGAPRERQFEGATVASQWLVITSLAKFDDVSTFREALGFQRQGNRWVPWQFTISPVEWPQANTYRFISSPAAEIVGAVRRTVPAKRAQFVSEQYAGRYTPQSGWALTVSAGGDQPGDRTCDVMAKDISGTTEVVLRAVLGGCHLRAGATIQVVGRVQAVDDRITLEAIRFWK